jgi:Zn-dependent protease
MIQYLVILLLLILWLQFLARRRRAAAPSAPPPVRKVSSSELPSVVQEVMEVAAATEESGVVVARGALRLPSADAFARLRSGLPEETRPQLRQGREGSTVLLLVPGRASRATPRPWLHWLLFALTLGTTTWAGALQQGLDLRQDPGAILRGLPYSLALMAILGIHELGHYFAARRHGMDVTPPYFIPVPFALGTFGAFIQMRSQPASRRALFDVAVAGPLAGLVVAVPALLVGLRSSQLIAGAPEELAVGAGTSVASSVMFAAVAKLALGAELGLGHAVRLSPLAFAGWLGLFVTALNLLPIGQLDGGHAARAMLGDRAGRVLSSVAMWSLLLLGLFVWPGLLMWAVIVFFLAGRGAPPADDLTPLPGGRWLVGLLTFALLVSLLLPLPHPLWPAAGLHCPYL